MQPVLVSHSTGGGRFACLAAAVRGGDRGYLALGFNHSALPLLKLLELPATPDLPRPPAGALPPGSGH
jgi:hypothetical protein